MRVSSACVCMVFAYNDCTMSHVDFIYMTVIRQEQLIKIQCGSNYLLCCYTNVDGIFKYSSNIQIVSPRGRQSFGPLNDNAYCLLF